MILLCISGKFCPLFEVVTADHGEISKKSAGFLARDLDAQGSER